MKVYMVVMETMAQDIKAHNVFINKKLANEYVDKYKIEYPKFRCLITEMELREDLSFLNDYYKMELEKL